MTKTEAKDGSRLSGGDFFIKARPCRGSRFRCGTEGGVEIGNVFLQKLESGLVVQRFRYHFAQLFALYHLGMAPGGRVLKGEGKPWIFMTFLGGVKSAKKHENAV